MAKKKVKHNIAKLVISIIIVQVAAIIGSFFTTPKISTWYASLIKPSFNPPNWVFGPVWTVLFVMMGISLYFIWRQKSFNKDVKKAFWLFGIQLFLNASWSILFFGLQNPLFAFIEIIILWVIILLTIIEFFRLSKVSGYLLLPYILWVSFAAVLNLAIVLIN